MSNPFDIFSGIFCINLDSRPEKWSESKIELKKVGILDRTERFSAIATPEKGSIGCAKSHIEIIKIAKARNLESVLVLEDDIQFEENCLEVLEKVIPQLYQVEPNMLYLGINPLSKFKIISENLTEVSQGYTTHAYIVPKKFYDIILNQFTIPIDVFYARLHSTYKHIFCVKPMVALQRPSYSDIEGIWQDNGAHIKERFEKFTT